MIDTDAIRERLKAATKGPWQIEEHPDGGDAKDVVSPAYDGVFIARYLWPEDAEFIMHARGDIEALLTRVDELTEQIDKVGPIPEEDS